MECIKKNDILEFEIEKLVYEGAGLARYGNLPIFIKNVCVGDVVKAKITQINKHFAKAILENIVTPSPFRIESFCPFHKVCGSCEWQFVDYNEQLRQKRQIVKETIKKIAGVEIEVNETLPSPDTKFYRHKIQMPIAQTKNSKRFLIGYYQENSHELVNIKYCAIQPEYANEIIETVRHEAQTCGVIAYNEKKHAGELRHLVLRFSQSEKNCVLTLVLNSNQPSPEIKKLAKQIYNKFDYIKGVVFNFNTKKTNTILSDKFETFVGDDFIYEQMGTFKFKISAGSFFQVNPKSAINLLNTAKDMIKSVCNAPTILDAYCGVGSFGIWMTDIAKNICGVEQTQSSCSDARFNLKLNNIKNYELIEGDVSEIFNEFVQQNRCFDVIITDPPRKGCSEKALQQMLNLGAKHIVYISCNPATLARDLKYLHNHGFETKIIQPVDMFCHSYHVENVVLLSKQ